MTEDIATLYVNELAELYNVSDKDREKMYSGSEQINQSLGKYYWEDIKRALQKFYTYHNDKSRPRLAQILAMLEANPNIAKREPDLPTPTVSNQTPTTNIRVISATFDKLVQVLTDGGVLPNADGNFSIKRSLVDPKTNNVVICPRQWLGWQIQDAMKARPDLFAKFNNLSWLEQLAIGVQNKLVVFKVRDWAKLAQEMPVDARNGNGWNNYTKKLQKAM